MKLTHKENKAFKVIVDNALNQMCGKQPEDLFDDNFSWFNRTDISTKMGCSKHEAAGLISALNDKSLIDKDGDWFITNNGIKLAQSIYGDL